jgi:hypothetical protein
MWLAMFLVVSNISSTLLCAFASGFVAGYAILNLTRDRLAAPLERFRKTLAKNSSL